MTDAPQNIDKNTTASAFDDAERDESRQIQVRIIVHWMSWKTVLQLAQRIERPIRKELSLRQKK